MRAVVCMCPINLSVLLGYLRKKTQPKARRRVRVMINISIGDETSPRSLVSHTLELGEAGMSIPAPPPSLHESSVREGGEMSITLSLPERPITVRASPVGTRSVVEDGARLYVLDLKITAVGEGELAHLRAFLAGLPESIDDKVRG